ncbi:DUF2939 domain-containing protein [Phenylobacterium sp. LjRoot219]|uniref:DUF2939 domain-containing protein n=1 Tax=Phenylobacterium sp. LjRoot219 TaxID=3342283 RepID=UPI003ECC7331
MSKKLIVGGAAAIVALLLGWYFASPLYAVHSLKAAATRGDAVRLEQLVDFPAVREGLKSQLNAMLMQSIQSDPELKDNPFAGMAALVVPALVERSVEAFITPDAISSMIVEGRTGRQAPAAAPPAAAAQPGPQPAAPAATTSPAPAEPKRPQLSYGYRDLDTFVVASQSREDAGGRIDFVLHRQGLFGWRLTRIHLPQDAIAFGGDGARAVTPLTAFPTAAAHG